MGAHFERNRPRAIRYPLMCFARASSGTNEMFWGPKPSGDVVFLSRLPIVQKFNVQCNRTNFPLQHGRTHRWRLREGVGFMYSFVADSVP